MDWIYQGRPFCFEEHTPEPFGFVYVITHVSSGKKYIGRKFFSKAGYKRVKKVRKKIRVPSDWKDYWSSSPILHEAIEELGKENFTREIIRLCYNRSSCSYYETKEILLTDAILSDEYYNNWFSAKITSAHVKAIKRG